MKAAKNDQRLKERCNKASTPQHPKLRRKRREQLPRIFNVNILLFVVSLSMPQRPKQAISNGLDKLLIDSLATVNPLGRKLELVKAAQYIVGVFPRQLPCPWPVNDNYKPGQC